MTFTVNIERRRFKRLEYLEMLVWLEENDMPINGDITIPADCSRFNKLEVPFVNEEDAMAFKLRWS